MSTLPKVEAPSLEAVQAARRELVPHVRETPAWQWLGYRLDAVRPPDSTLWLKLETFQHTGSFKVRGALLSLQRLDAAQRARGVTAVSGGNHAIAVAWAAKVVGTHAKVVMPKTANAARVDACRALGGDIELVDDVAAAFARVRELEADERRFLVHPFDSEPMVLGAGVLGMELLRQVGQLDALFVAVGGGGLAAGVAAAVKQLQPRCRVYGVEPAGADSMHRSFAAGSPQRIDAVRTIADSLGAPMALDYTFALCRRFVDELVMVDDEQICRAMWLLFADGKVATEPAGAATAAAMLQLRERLAGQRVGMILCGANVDHATFAQCLARGAPR